MRLYRACDAGDERGAALVEFALVVPILLVLLMAMLDFGKAFNYWIDETQLASSGARWAVVNTGPRSVPRRHDGDLACVLHPVPGRHERAPKWGNELGRQPGESLHLIPAGSRPLGPPRRRPREGDGVGFLQVAADHRPEDFPSGHDHQGRVDDAPRGASDLHRVVHGMSYRDADRKNERGSVLVMTALWLPVIILMASFVIDAGNWFEHKRHLQLQADAGAFAAGSLFNGCFGDQAAANSLIDAQVRKYSGDPGAVSPYNLQIGGSNQGAVTVRVNKKLYQVGGPPPDDTVEDVPCAAKMVDVKITEAGLPWFLSGGIVSAINARARIQLEQKGSSSHSLPIGVPDNNPLAAAAIFIDESNANTVLATEQLTNPTPATLNGQSLIQWTGLPVAVNLTHPNIGVVIALAGKAGWTPPPGNLTAICNNVLVECYSVTQDATGAVTAATGIDFIHSYSTAGTGTAAVPIVRDVTLTNVGCTDQSGPYFLLNAACTVGVRAKIDFGVANPSTIAAIVKVPGYLCPNSGNPKGCPLTYQTAGPDLGYWTTTAAGGYPTMPADGVGHPIDLNWQTGSGGSAPKGTFTSVQRSFSAGSDTSGPVAYIRADDAAPYANSLPFGSDSISVRIGVKPSVQANQSSPTAPAVALKVLGSQTQAIDCDPSKSNLKTELAEGCTPVYAINKGTPCQPYSYYNFPQSEDWLCTRTQTGGAVGQVYQGMLDRTQGGVNSCVNRIHWVDSNGDGKITIPEDILPNDPRLVATLVTPFGSFSGSGNAVVPIVNFATFYVTGFSKQGGGQGDPCNPPPIRYPTRPAASSSATSSNTSTPSVAAAMELRAISAHSARA